jgi:hypothetical protein
MHAYRENNKTALDLYKREYHLRTAYNLTLEEFAEIFNAQGGKCGMPGCGATESGGRNWHVDHDHLTKKVRAILCNDCNVRLGFYEQNRHRFAQFERYLRECV